MPTKRIHRILDAITDKLWWSGHSSTHHNPEMPDPEQMARELKRLRRDGEHDKANDLQAIMDWQPAPQHFDVSKITNEEK